jgi:dGTPase
MFSNIDRWKGICKENFTREDQILGKYACKSIVATREEPEDIPDNNNIRPAFFHDADRILHSMAYARYIDKTQVFFLVDNDHITHRVLHVQLVSKIARTIGRCLKLNEDLIEAISLGHDIGHVPYGHDGERYLSSIFQNYEQRVFCHNAQSVRFLTQIENKGKGWNLTLQVLDGILCHNGEMINDVYETKPSKTWDNFWEEYDRCWKEYKFDKKLKPMTLEACVMRVSDIIAYIGRDIEDAIRVGLIVRDQLPAEATSVIGNNNRDIIMSLAWDIINNSYGKPYLTFSKPIKSALDMLLDFNNEYIYKNSVKCSQDSKIKKMFDVLFNNYLDDIEKNNLSSSIFKEFLKGMDDKYIQENSPTRIVLDYIAGMTDDFFNNEFRNLVLPRKFGLTFKNA